MSRMITGTSTTLMNCATTAPVVAHNGHVNDHVQAQVRQAATVGARLSPPRLHSRNVDHLINVLQLENLHGRPRESASAPRQGCRRTPRRCMTTGTSTTAGTAPAASPCTCRRNNGHVNTLSKNCNCGTPRAALSGRKTPVLHNNGQDNLV